MSKQENKNNVIFLLTIILVIILIIIKLVFNIFNNIKTIENFKNTKKYKMVIMTIFKNEQDYMEEWLDHHYTQGFDQIFMYCNDPNIQNYSFLNKIKYQNFVTLINWINKTNIGSHTIQRQAYTHCVKTYSNQCQFILMLDLDEFIVPIKNYSNVYEYINELEPEWNNIKCLKIQRYDFGSNGHIDKPEGNIISNYKYHEKICSSYKTMANTDFVDKNAFFYGVHDFNFLNKHGKIYNDYFGYHETGFPNSCKANSINEIPLVINHYYTKSYKEYLSRCKLWDSGGINPIGHRSDCENKFKTRDINEIEGH